MKKTGKAVGTAAVITKKNDGKPMGKKKVTATVIKKKGK